MNAKAYVHEMVRALLIYEPDTVERLIRRYRPRWRLFSGRRLVAVRPEVGLSRFADAVWVYVARNRVGHPIGYAVFFEVKTGVFTQAWVVQLRGFVEELPRVRRAFATVFGRERVDAMHSYYVYICREDQIGALLREARRVYGHVTAFPIELLLPVAVSRFEKAIEVARGMVRRRGKQGF